MYIFQQLVDKKCKNTTITNIIKFHYFLTKILKVGDGDDLRSMSALVCSGLVTLQVT